VAAQGERTIELRAPSSCELRVRDKNRLLFALPKEDAFLSVARSEFRDFDELAEHVAQLLSLELKGGQLRGLASRRGKYERRDEEGNRVFSFGDPLLDLITNPTGELRVGGRRFDLARTDLGSARRRGGLSEVDLSEVPVSAWHAIAARASMGEGDYVLLECSKEGMALGSTNPSQYDWFRNNYRDHLRFKAWKKNWGFYWSMGAEIETWNHDFDTARIDSRYLGEVATGICTQVDQDSDSDSDDDYVDEYEWGINSEQPLRVISICTARWRGEYFARQVEAGPACYEL
jgi:hypothetical protein